MKWHAENIYNREGYFDGSDGQLQWRNGQLKCGDALCALAYMVGISSFEEAVDIFKFENNKGNMNNYIHEGVTVLDQVKLLKENFKDDKPKHVLEIGAGRGEVSLVLSSMMDIKTTSIEPCSGYDKLLKRTETYYKTPLNNDNITIINKDVKNSLDYINWDDIDVVIMVESLEHILKEDFDLIYPKIVDVLTKNSGKLIITNWISFHPIAVGQYASPEEHCRLVDDNLYDSFERDAKSTIQRDGAHLVLKY